MRDTHPATETHALYLEATPIGAILIVNNEKIIPSMERVEH